MAQQKFTLDDIQRREDKYLAHNYHSLPIVPKSCEGVYITDISGRRVMDMISGYSSVGLGYRHPKMMQAWEEAGNDAYMTSRAILSPYLGLLAEKLVKITNLDAHNGMFLPSSGGAEAVETAIKAARRWAYEVKDVEADRAEIIVCNNNFHGRSSGPISMSSNKGYRRNFGPHLPGIAKIPFGDAEALEGAIHENTAAFIVEPMQGEGGIIVPEKGWLKRVSQICKKHNVLLILDEIQTGFGRTGKLFAAEHDDVTPDMYILGKAMGGGFYPVSGIVGKGEVMQVFDVGSHGSTFGGNGIASYLALTAIELIESQGLVQQSADLGDYFKDKLIALQKTHPSLVDVRGIGLFIGAEISKEYGVSGMQAAEMLLEQDHPILTKDTQSQTLRFTPPLIISKDQIDTALNSFEAVLNLIEAKSGSSHETGPTSISA